MFLIAACVCFVFPGEIIRYILLRDGVELFRGLDTEFTDDRNVLPYRTYSYILSACTTAGCTNSPVVSGVVTEMAYHTGSASRTVLNVAVYSSASINPLCVAGDGDNSITLY